MARRGFISDRQRRAVMRKFNSQFLRPIPLRTNRLPVQVSTIIPSTNRDKPLSNAKFESRIGKERRWWSSRFGGDTSINDVGGYWLTKKNGKKQFISEPGVIVESSMSIKTYEKNKKFIANHLKKMREEWKQDTILFKVEGETFIYPKKSFIDHDSSRNDSSIQVV